MKPLNIELFQKSPAAYLISRILGPFSLTSTTFFLVILKSDLDFWKLLIGGPLMFVLIIGLPFLAFFGGQAVGRISDWDVTLRSERSKLFLTTIASWSVALFLTLWQGNASLFKLMLAMYILLVAFWGVSLFWKVSLHAAGATAAFFIWNFLFDWQMGWIFLLLPLVFWARWRLSKHSLKQILAGSGISFIILMALFAF